MHNEVWDWAEILRSPVDSKQKAKSPRSLVVKLKKPEFRPRKRGGNFKPGDKDLSY